MAAPIVLRRTPLAAFRVVAPAKMAATTGGLRAVIGHPRPPRAGLKLLRPVVAGQVEAKVGGPKGVVAATYTADEPLPEAQVGVTRQPVVQQVVWGVA